MEQCIDKFCKYGCCSNIHECARADADCNTKVWVTWLLGVTGTLIGLLFFLYVVYLILRWQGCLKKVQKVSLNQNSEEVISHHYEFHWERCCNQSDKPNSSLKNEGQARI